MKKVQSLFRRTRKNQNEPSVALPESSETKSASSSDEDQGAVAQLEAGDAATGIIISGTVGALTVTGDTIKVGGQHQESSTNIDEEYRKLKQSHATTITKGIGEKGGKFGISGSPECSGMKVAKTSCKRMFHVIMDCYIQPQTALTAVIFSKDEVIQSLTRKQLHEDGFHKLALVSHHILGEMGSQISVSMECKEPAECFVTGVFPSSTFTVDDDYFEKGREAIYFELEPEPADFCKRVRVLIGYKVDGEREHYFPLKSNWPPTRPARENIKHDKSQITASNYFTGPFQVSFVPSSALDCEKAKVVEEHFHEHAGEVKVKESAESTQDRRFYDKLKESKVKESAQSTQDRRRFHVKLKESKGYTEVQEELGCAICYDRMLDETLPCDHRICAWCLSKWLSIHCPCPFCREEYNLTLGDVAKLLKKIGVETAPSKDTPSTQPPEQVDCPLATEHQTGSEHLDPPPRVAKSESQESVITNVSTGEPQVDQRNTEFPTNPDVQGTSKTEQTEKCSSGAQESEITKTSTGESQVDEQNPELLPSLELPANPDMQGTSTTEQTGECSTSADDKQTSEDEEFGADDDSEYQEDNYRKNEPPMEHVIDRAVNSCKKNQVFTLSHQKFSEADIQYLVKSLQEIPKDFRIRIIGLRNCSVDEKFLQELQKCGREVNEIDFSANQELDVPNLIKFLKGAKPKSLDLSDCNLDRDEMEKLAEVQVESLKLNYKAFVDDSAAAPLAQSLSRGLKMLELVDSSISTEDLQIFAKGPSISLQCLDLAHVPLDEDDMAAVAGIVNRTNEMKRLGLSKCYITTEGLKEFHDNVSEKVHELDVSYNEEIDEAGDRLLGQIVTKCETAILDISGRQLDKENIKELRRNVKQMVLEVSLSENPGIDTSEVGKMVVEWKVERLNLSECRLEAQDLFDLCDSMESHELQLLDVSDPTDAVSKHKRSALQALSKKVKRLDFGDHQTWT